MADEKTFTQEDLDAAVEKAVGPLKSKLDEVMDEAKTAKRKLREASEIKPEDMQRLEEQVDALKADLTAAQKDAKEATKRAETAETALTTESSFTQKLLIQDGLKSALIANGVKDEDFIDTLAAKFAAGATVVVDGDKRIAKIGDKPVADAIKEWAVSDAGKKFVEAPVNSGGGAQGGKGGGGNGKTVTQEQFDGMNAKDRAAFFAGGGAIAAQA